MVLSRWKIKGNLGCAAKAERRHQLSLQFDNVHRERNPSVRLHKVFRNPYQQQLWTVGPPAAITSVDYPERYFTLSRASLFNLCDRIKAKFMHFCLVIATAQYKMIKRLQAVKGCLVMFYTVVLRRGG